MQKWDAECPSKSISLMLILINSRRMKIWELTAEEQGERFHQDIMDFERRYQGQYKENMMRDYFWWLLQESDLQYSRKCRKSIHFWMPLTGFDCIWVLAMRVYIGFFVPAWTEKIRQFCLYKYETFVACGHSIKVSDECSRFFFHALDMGRWNITL